MTYQRLGLAALVVSALRAAVADPAEQAQVDENTRQIGEVRSGMDELVSQLALVRSDLASRGAIDDSTHEQLAGIEGELQDLATALTGPKADPTDNGVIAEVAPTDEAPTSDAADAIADGSSAVDLGDAQPVDTSGSGSGSGGDAGAGGGAAAGDQGGGTAGSGEADAGAQGGGTGGLDTSGGAGLGGDAAGQGGGTEDGGAAQGQGAGAEQE